MEEINKIIGKNLMSLRKNMKLTQLEFAEKFNYSDKSISKWETGESLPSIDVLYQIANFYGVTLDDLVKPELTNEPIKKVQKQKMFSTKLMVTLLSSSAVWLIATLVFVMLKIFADINYGLSFLWAVPVTCVVLIVFNAIWGHWRYFFIIVSVLLWSVLAGVHVQVFLVSINIWPIYIIGIPLQIAIILWGAMMKKPKKEKITKA